MKLIPLKGRYGQGKFAKVDDKWAELVKYSWRVIIVRKKEYVIWKTTRKGKSKMLYLHRLILGSPKGLMVDHHNGDTYDYQEANLRVATNSQNQMNSKKRSGQSSLYKNVSWSKQRGAWKAQIKVDGHDFFIGYFDIERHAAMAVDLNLPALHGEFTKPNFT